MPAGSDGSGSALRLGVLRAGEEVEGSAVSEAVLGGKREEEDWESGSAAAASWEAVLGSAGFAAVLFLVLPLGASAFSREFSSG